MRSKIEKRYLIKAIDAFKRRLIIVSPKFKILAANRETDGMKHSEISGKYCYNVFYDRTSPCENCAVEASMGKGKPILMPKPEESLDLNKMPCYYAYPILSGDDIEAFVSMDFDMSLLRIRKGKSLFSTQRQKDFLATQKMKLSILLIFGIFTQAIANTKSCEN
jgi:hypothetical protein